MLNYSKEANEKIYTTLFYHYYHMCNKYGEDNVFGIFAIGSMNYGSYDPALSDVDTRVVLIPTVDEILSLKPAPISTSEDIDNEKCSIQDIRAFFKGLLNQNPNSLEVLTTPYLRINPKWQFIWDEYIAPNTEEIAHLDRARFVSSSLGQIMQFLTNTKLTQKQIYHCQRLATTCQMYIEGYPLQECIQLLDTQLQQTLNAIKYSPEPTPIDNAMFLDAEIKMFNDFIQENKIPHIESYIHFTEALKKIFLLKLNEQED
jgi:predicted nucleotidyltransferase